MDAQEQYTLMAKNYDSIPDSWKAKSKYELTRNCDIAKLKTQEMLFELLKTFDNRNM